MKKYLGSPITVFAAILAPLFIFLPLLFGIYALCTNISVATIILALGSVCCSVLWMLYLKEICIQLYSWGHFRSGNVLVQTALKKATTIQYARCAGCGIGYYTHGFLNYRIGIKIYFIFLSYDEFDEQYRSKINLWKPTKTRIKVRFSKELYDYLISILPSKQAKKLARDYKKYLD